MLNPLYPQPAWSNSVSYFSQILYYIRFIWQSFLNLQHIPTHGEQSGVQSLAPGNKAETRAQTTNSTANHRPTTISWSTAAFTTVRLERRCWAVPCGWNHHKALRMDCVSFHVSVERSSCHLNLYGTDAKYEVYRWTSLNIMNETLPILWQHRKILCNMVELGRKDCIFQMPSQDATEHFHIAGCFLVLCFFQRYFVLEPVWQKCRIIFTRHC